MKVDLAGRVAIISASSQGMGLACARAFARSDAAVVVLARRPERLATAAAELEAIAPGRVLAIPADVAKADAISRVFDSAIARFGRVDILVNNTGGPRPGSLAELTDEDWNSAYESIVLSAVRFSRLVVPGMRERKWGRIINITSILARQPSPGMGLSNSLRAAVLGFAKTLSREVAADGVTVNTLCPGAVATERFESLLAGDATDEGVSIDEMRRRTAAGIPAGFIATPDDFAAAALFLASPDARYITGTVMSVDGGEYRGLS